MFIHSIPDADLPSLQTTFLRELQTYQPVPSFFGTIPRPEEGIVVSHTHRHYLPASEGVATILDLAQWYFEASGLSADPLEHAVVEYWLFHYNDAAFHDTSLSGSPRSDMHLCIFLLHQDMLISPTYIDVFPESESIWSYLGWDDEESETHCLQAGKILVIPAHRRFKLHGCSGFGVRHLLCVYINAK